MSFLDIQPLAFIIPLMRYRMLLIFVLINAAVVRLFGLVTISPPGLSHDEVANWLIDRSILDGNHAVYFTQAYGHEAGFHYWQTFFVWLVGDHALSLRLPAALLGIMATAVSYLLIQRLFGKEWGIPATAFVAALFMPVFFSRQGLRAMALPVTAGLSAYFVWCWLFPRTTSAETNQAAQGSFWPGWGNRQVWLGALFAGLSSYTYMASRALPIFFALFFLYLALVDRPRIRRNLSGILLFGIVYLAVSLPLIRFLQTTPAADFRVSEVNLPLEALRQGDIIPVWNNGLAILGSFGISGDPLWRQNVYTADGSRPVPIFGPAAAILFYAGLLIALWHWRQPRYGFLLIWLASSIAPSLVTIDAPSTIRMILLVPILGIFPILPFEYFLTKRYQIGVNQGGPDGGTRVPIYQQLIHSYPRLSTTFPQLSTGKAIIWWVTCLTFAILAFYDLRTMTHMLSRWPDNPEVAFVWQTSFNDIGLHIDENWARDDTISQSLTIAGWTPDTMDYPTLQLVTQQDPLPSRHVGKVGTIETVALAGTQEAILYRPSALPLSTAIESYLLELGSERSDYDSFVQYVVPSLLMSENREPLASFALATGSGTDPVSLDLLSWETAVNEPNGTLEALSVWQISTLPTDFSLNGGEVRTFLHHIDQQGVLVAQHDGLDYPHRFWQLNDLLIQQHTIPLTAAEGTLKLGLYINQEPFQRFVNGSGDHVEFPVQP